MTLCRSSPIFIFFCDIGLSLEGFPIQDVNKTALVDEDPRHHEVCYDDGDNHGVVLVDKVDALEVLVRKGDRRETSL